MKANHPFDRGVAARIPTLHCIVYKRRLTHLLSSRILVDDPLIEKRPPILNEKRLSVFLTLSIAEATLCLGPRNQVVFLQVDLQVLSHLAANLSFWTPCATVFLLV